MPSVPPQRPVVAAFDFDKTLSSRDCVIPFVRRILSSQRLLRSLGDVPDVFLAGARRDRDRLKSILTRRVFAGLHRTMLDREALDFARHVQDRWMRSDTLEMLTWHKSRGHRTGLVSASYGMYLRPIGDALGVDFVIASELEFDSDGCATGRLIDGNCRGPEKARRLRSWLKENELENSLLYAYGDSSGDKELLEMSDHPHNVRKVLK